MCFFVFVLGVSKSRTLFNDLTKMYKTGKFSDIILKAKDKQFSAHKAVLASRCKVFDAMFQHDMKEAQTGVVEIVDIEPVVLGSLLQYIYTGNVDDFTIQKAMSLFPATNKYFLDELKEWCVDKMVANLTVKNVCQIAALVTFYPDPKLKAAIFYMFRNFKTNIFEKKEWKELIRDPNHFLLITETLQAITTDFCTNVSTDENTATSNCICCSVNEKN